MTAQALVFSADHYHDQAQLSNGLASRCMRRSLWHRHRVRALGTVDGRGDRQGAGRRSVGYVGGLGAVVAVGASAVAVAMEVGLLDNCEGSTGRIHIYMRMRMGSQKQRPATGHRTQAQSARG